MKHYKFETSGESDLERNGNLLTLKANIQPWEFVQFLSTGTIQEEIQPGQVSYWTQCNYWLADGLINRRTDTLTDWRTEWLIDELINGRTDTLTDALTDWLTNWLTDGLINRQTDTLTDWLIDWLTD